VTKGLSAALQCSKGGGESVGLCLALFYFWQREGEMVEPAGGFGQLLCDLVEAGVDGDRRRRRRR
jgi:hypothetical protein